VGTTTSQRIGRQGEACLTREIEDTLKSARRIFADVSAFLELEIDRLFEIEVNDLDRARAKAVQSLIRDNQKALMMVLEIEAKLGHDTGPRHQQMIDLEAARDEIEDRLARLAA